MGDSRTLASLNSKFFSSLKQVEKRLKLEHSSQSSTISQSPLPESSKLLAEGSLSSPLYLYSNQLNNNNNNGSSGTIQDSSEPPEAFLSCSPQFTPTQQNPPQAIAWGHPGTIKETEFNAVDDIEQLMKFLGLSSCEEGEKERACLDDGDSCHCEGGFYDKIVGVKGPKCGKEVERLEGWIDYFLNGGGEERIEPFRLVHLLLGKAAFVSEGADHGFGGLEFPSMIEDFLLHDPPPKSS